MNERPGLSRRALLRTGIVTGVGGVLVTVDASGASAAPASGPLSFADFALLVGTEFTIRDAEGRVHRLRLVDAKATPVVSATAGVGEAYSLVFTGDRADRVDPAIYTLSHRSLGEIDLFLHPVGAERAYEAVVNHWRPISK